MFRSEATLVQLERTVKYIVANIRDEKCLKCAVIFLNMVNKVPD